MKQITVVAAILVLTLLCSCKKETFYSVQFRNQTNLTLDTIKVNICDDETTFGLEDNATSETFVMTSMGRQIVGPNFLHFHVKVFSSTEGTFTRDVANMLAVNELDEDHLNTINIMVADTLQPLAQTDFRLEIVK